MAALFGETMYSPERSTSFGMSTVWPFADGASGCHVMPTFCGPAPTVSGHGFICPAHAPVQALKVESPFRCAVTENVPPTFRILVQKIGHVTPSGHTT